jgi:tetratricopeptide (TPR) repeat protein
VHDLANAAAEVLFHTPQTLGYFDVLARATAYQANALRASGKLREAAERMASARSIIRHENVTDLLVYAEVDWMEGILHKDERRFREAESLLTRSAVMFQLAGDRVEAARPLLTLGLGYYDQQLLAKAIETTEASLVFVQPESEPRLYLCGRFNLAVFYAESGRDEAAAALLAEDEALYHDFPDRWTALRKRWLLGRIALRRGDLGEAEAAFLEVRAGFLDQGIGYDAAMVSLELALVYLRQSRTAELRNLAEEMHAVFAAEDVHREALAALLLFQEAVRTEALTAELIEEMTVYV